MERVAILGASDKPERYSYKAMKLLQEKGYEVLLVHPRLKEIEGQRVYAGLGDIKGDFHTLTLYISPKLQEQVRDDILQCPASRVIFNPGTENEELVTELEKKGVLCEQACTLVLLQTSQF